eukprot:6185600-Pleurochrysis_carterae.AAC.2
MGLQTQKERSAEGAPLRTRLRPGARRGLYDQTFCVTTMRSTSLRAPLAIANSAGMRMRRWDFVAAYLQGDLKQNEVVYCHAPPGYATIGADGRPRLCRVVKTTLRNGASR